jgi:flagellar basal-body rod modification protein FlgD
MATSAVSAVGTTPTAANNCDLNALTSADFFKLLVSELRQQDPLQPAKTSDLVAQVSQIRSIELSKNLTDALTQVTHNQRVAGASELLGKYVTAIVAGTDGTSQQVSGVVTGVQFDASGGAVLELDTGQFVPADSVTHITSPENAAVAAATANATTGSAAATTNATANAAAAAAKTTQTAQDLHPRLLPFVNLDGEFHL